MRTETEQVIEVTILIVQGRLELGADSVGKLRKSFNELVNSGHKYILIDMLGVSSIADECMGELKLFCQKLETTGGILKFVFPKSKRASSSPQAFKFVLNLPAFANRNEAFHNFEDAGVRCLKN